MGKKGKIEELLLDKMKHLSIDASLPPVGSTLAPAVQSLGGPPASQTISGQTPPASQAISGHPPPASHAISGPTPPASQYISGHPPATSPNISDPFASKSKQHQPMESSRPPHQIPESSTPEQCLQIRKLDAWFQFLKKLPSLPDSLVIKLKSDVYEYLELGKLDMSLINLHDINTEDFKVISSMEALEEKTGFGYSNVVAPPIKDCLLCNNPLHLHNKPTNIVIHGFEGPRIGSTYTLRCKRCKAVGDNSVNYRPDMFGNDNTGWVFYDEEPTFIKATSNVYLELKLVKYILACLHHVWASFEGSAEVYNEVHRTSETVNIIKKFFEENPKGKDDDNGKEEAPFLKTKWKAHELSRKNVSRAVWTVLVQQELKGRSMKLVFKVR